MDLGEAGDEKGVVVFDVGPAGLAGEPRTLPVEATPVYEVKVTSPRVELPALRVRWWDTINARFDEAVIPARTIVVQPAANQPATAATPAPVPTAATSPARRYPPRSEPMPSARAWRRC